LIVGFARHGFMVARDCMNVKPKKK
jgi:hypothetical protein